MIPDKHADIQVQLVLRSDIHVVDGRDCIVHVDGMDDDVLVELHMLLRS